MDNILGLLEKLEGQSLSVDPTRCVVVRNRNAQCRKCAQACPTGALYIEGNSLSVDPMACVGCGACATVCPTAALGSQKPHDAELLREAVAAMQANDGVAVIIDEGMEAAAYGKFEPTKVSVVKNLARVDESLIAVLAAGGATSIVLVAGPREDIAAEENGKDDVDADNDGAVADSVNSTARLVCDTAALLLETWKSSTTIKLTDKLPRSVRATDQSDYDATRRGFFSSMRDEARSAATITAGHIVQEKLGNEETPAPKVVKVGKDGTLPHFLPQRRGRLLLALSNMGEPEDVMVDTRLFGQVIIDTEKCTSCMMCATFCPTEAIRKFGDPDTAQETGKACGVEHYAGRCVQCHCCEDICPENALTLSTDVFAADVTKRTFSERIEMRPRKRKMKDSKSILNTMRNLLATPNVYER